MSDDNIPPAAPATDVGAISPPSEPATQSTMNSTCTSVVVIAPEKKEALQQQDNHHYSNDKTKGSGGNSSGTGGAPKRSAQEMEIQDSSSQQQKECNQQSSTSSRSSPHNHDIKRVKINNDVDTKNSSSIKHDEQQQQQQQQQPAIVDEEIVYPSRGNMITSNGNPNEVKRWRSHRIAEDYIQLAAQMMMPGIHLAPFGYDATTGHFPIESITALSVLLSPMRRPMVVEKWSPYEIAVFEAALAVVGKEFHQVQKFVKTKNTKEIIEFYYIWKKTAQYKVWKRQYILPEDDVDSDDD